MIKRTIRTVVLAGCIIQPVFAEDQQPSVASQLLLQLQTLQQEVLELRGLTEEQAYQLKRLKGTQQDHYLDLDRRIGTLQRKVADAVVPGNRSPAEDGLASTPVASMPTTAAPQSLPAVSTQPEPVEQTNPAVGGSVEREANAYNAAYGLVKGKKFEAASLAFQQLLLDFPSGKYTPNAHYWLGELYMVESDLQSAANAFTNVVTKFPDHWKSADALYKLGEINYRLDAPAKSKQYLNRVIKQFPDSTAARFASRYLKANFPQQ